MSRFDLFLFAHKGLRAAMFDAGIQLGRADFGVPGVAAAMAPRLRTVLGFLREHAEHEDRTIFPAVARFSAPLAAGLQTEHGLIAGQEQRLEQLLDRLDGAQERELAAIGARVRSQWHVVVAQHLAHMEREEQEANRALHANLSDAELGVLHAAVLGSISAARRAEWQNLILPALTAAERRTLARRLGPLGAGGPA